MRAGCTCRGMGQTGHDLRPLAPLTPVQGLFGSTANREGLVNRGKSCSSRSRNEVWPPGPDPGNASPCILTRRTWTNSIAGMDGATSNNWNNWGQATVWRQPNSRGTSPLTSTLVQDSWLIATAVITVSGLGCADKRKWIHGMKMSRQSSTTGNNREGTTGDRPRFLRRSAAGFGRQTTSATANPPSALPADAD